MIFKDVNNMETNINIAEILKDKPQGTKLHDLLYNIEVELDTISTTDTETVVWCTNETDNNTTCHRGYSEFGTVRGCHDGLQILLPSKEMRDWSKFAWKKGDVLINGRGVICIFIGWTSDDYTKFHGCYSNENNYGDVPNAETAKFDKTDNILACEYIKGIERKLGGKLNLETLEIVKPAFKDGDILCVIANSTDYHYILIYEGQDDEHIYRYVTMLENHSLIIEKGSYFTKPKDYSIRYATEEEKQQLFDALAKEGKAWDAEKKQIVNLKPKADKLKPFDKVLVKDEYYGSWEPAFFWKEVDVEDLHPYMIIGGKRYRFCVPYEGNESLLGTTKDVED